MGRETALGAAGPCRPRPPTRPPARPWPRPCCSPRLPPWPQPARNPASRCPFEQMLCRQSQGMAVCGLCGFSSWLHHMPRVYMFVMVCVYMAVSVCVPVCMALVCVPSVEYVCVCVPEHVCRKRVDTGSRGSWCPAGLHGLRPKVGSGLGDPGPWDLSPP